MCMCMCMGAGQSEGVKGKVAQRERRRGEGRGGEGRRGGGRGEGGRRGEKGRGGEGRGGKGRGGEGRGREGQQSGAHTVWIPSVHRILMTASNPIFLVRYRLHRDTSTHSLTQKTYCIHNYTA